MIPRKAVADYHRYLANSPDSEVWGVAVTAAGRQVSKVGTAYPPAGHPSDHAFTWNRGRVLPNCHVVFIIAGRGRIESRATGLLPVEAGTALIVLPGVWHRYTPDPATGWAEHWIELRGRVVENLLRKGVLNTKRVIVPVARPLELEGIYESIHARLDGEAVPGCDPERAALGLQVLARVSNASERRRAARSITMLISRAEHLLADALEQSPAMPAIARELGVAYSYFRREFKQHTGLSPQRYLSQLRLDKARRLMGATDESLKEIADRLGFSSPYHLSAAFKRHFGVAPTHWRRRTDFPKPDTATGMPAVNGIGRPQAGDTAGVRHDNDAISGGNVRVGSKKATVASI